MTEKWLVVTIEWSGWFKRKNKEHYFDSFSEAMDFFQSLPKTQRKTYPALCEVENELHSNSL